MSLASTVELVSPARASTGENPVWSDEERALYWIDIEEPALHRLEPVAGVDKSWKFPSEIGAFALCGSGAVIMALRTGLAIFSPADGGFKTLCAPPYNPLKFRFNDGKCDALGRFWIGTMHDPLQDQTVNYASARPLGFYSHESGFQQRDAYAVIAKGLAWSHDSRRMYFSDSHARRIWTCAYDLRTATLSSPVIFAEFDEKDGTPDGASNDEDGFYWCALYGGRRVLSLSPDGRLDREIRLPISQPTMCAFGDPDYSTLYITSAAHGVENEPLAGGVFACRPGVRGLPPALFSDA